MIDPEPGSKWRHKARLSIYEVITVHCSMQCSAAPEFEKMFEDDNWVVYQSVISRFYFVRPLAEFMDGRFERIE